jgi:hypothetical protein
VSAANDPHERIEALERENRALREANARLMAERLGSSNTAAASRLVARAPAPRSRPAVAAPLVRGRLLLRRALLRILR